MQRPPLQPRRETIAKDELPAYDSVVDRFRAWFEADDASSDDHFEVGDYFGALLVSPKMCAKASQMGAFFRDVGNKPGSYSHADREFVDQVLADEFKSNVVQHVHIIDAVKAGVRIEAVEALCHGEYHKLNEDERLLDRYIRQVVRGTVDDETYGRMQDRMGIRGLVEYTGFILWLQWIMRMMQALNTGNISDEEVDRLIEEARQLKPEGSWTGGGGQWNPADAEEPVEPA